MTWLASSQPPLLKTMFSGSGSVRDVPGPVGCRRARYTSPMPPAPSGATIVYGPTDWPVESDIGADYRRGAHARALTRAPSRRGASSCLPARDFVPSPNGALLDFR